MTLAQVKAIRDAIGTREDGSARALTIRTEEARIYRSNLDVFKWDDANNILYIIRPAQDAMTLNVQANYPIEVIGTYYEKIVNIVVNIQEDELDFTANKCGYSANTIAKMKDKYSKIFAGMETHVSDKNRRPEQEI